MKTVDVNKVYKHHSGTEYHPICVTNKLATKPGWTKMVVYTDENNTVYSRSETEFLQKMEKIEKKSMHIEISKLLNNKT